MTSESTQTDRWWRNRVAYQVYVRSFKDSDGDGIGDLAGVREALEQIADMGVSMVWINPCYPSPQRDHGYDVADYRDINPDYGGLAEFDALVADAHALGIKVLMDIVPNHSSDQHAWFQAAIAARPGSAERDRFLFHDAKAPDAPDADEPPSSWPSIFGGSAWDRVPDGSENPQWYLHMFDTTQPDFNWRNEEVRAEFADILRFWFDRGVDGFRIDVAHGLIKADPLPVWDEGQSGLWAQPELDGIYRQWREIADSYEDEKYFVGEAWVDSPETAALFTAPGRLHQVFAFDLLVQPWFAHRLRAAIDRCYRSAGAEDGPAWALTNHDVHRLVTRLGQRQVDKDPDPADMLIDARRTWAVDADLGVRRARAAAALLFALPGTAYVYQGEELGLDEVLDLPDEARQDPAWLRTNGKDLGRDGCRVPLPWSAEGSSMGFGPDDGQEPWLPQPERFRDFARDIQTGDPESMLSLYRDLIRGRRELLGEASRIEWIDSEEDSVVAFKAGALVCMTNTGDENVAIAWEGADDARLVLNTAGGAQARVLPADSTTWYRVD